MGLRHLSHLCPLAWSAWGGLIELLGACSPLAITLLLTLVVVVYTQWCVTWEQGTEGQHTIPKEQDVDKLLEGTRS